jgi:glycosyltransferase involved in cell wall biosynthesis
MKILYTNFHTGDGGGHTTYILNLAAALGPRHRVTIAAPRSSRLYLYARQIPGVEVVAMGFRNTLTSMIGTGLALRRLIEKHGFDIVHVNGSADHRIAMLATMGLGRDSPCIVFTKHNDLPARGVTTWFKGKLGTDSVICVSAYTRRRLAQTVYGRKVNRVVRHGIDLGRFAPVSAAAVSRIRSRFLPGIPEDALVVGSVAGMDDNKGWLDMVTAVAMLPDSLRKRVHIVLAGQLPDATQRSRVAALGMARQVTYTGMLRDVRPAVALMDVGFVLSQRETLSFACREMMAMGKPVIVSDTGGLPENVTPGEDGWLVPPGGHGYIAQLLMLLLCNPSEVERAATAARAKSEAEFSLQIFASRTEAVYVECLSRVSPLVAEKGLAQRVARGRAASSAS